MGIAGFPVPKKEAHGKQLKEKRLTVLPIMPAFHFGKFTPHAALLPGPNMVGHPFPYQELSILVLLWHATCIEIGQILRHRIGNGKGKDQEQRRGNREQGSGNREQ